MPATTLDSTPRNTASSNGTSTLDTKSNSKTLHLVGIGVKHSIAPPMHNFIAKSLGLPWTFHSTECTTVEEAIALGRSPTTAGLVVTMPFKNSVMKHLDVLDELATSLNACNNVYRDPKNPEILRGTNTDWLGIRGCLLENAHIKPQPISAAGLIIGAGGASRAAVYTLNNHLHCSTIYVLNRDDEEVEALVRDSQHLSPIPTITHVKSPEQARSLEAPHFIVGTVPDFEPQTSAEKAVAASLEAFLSQTEKGILLDMCFKPRRTRIIKSAERNGWLTVEGTHVIGYQIEEQWRRWAGEKLAEKLDRDGAWKVLLKAAEESPGINF